MMRMDIKESVEKTNRTAETNTNNDKFTQALSKSSTDTYTRRW